MAPILQTNTYTMITQYEVPGQLTKVLPSFTSVPGLCPLSMDIYKEIQHFTEYTRKAIDKHDYVLAKRCFFLADKLYRQGDAVVRNVIENIFIFSFSSFIPQDHVEKLILKSFIPANLYSVYVKQISQSGC